MPKPRFIRWFDELTINDVASVGGKNASLGEMFRELTPQGIRVPNGFAITAEAYRHVLRVGDLEKQLRGQLRDLDTGDLAGLAERGRRLREIMLSRPLPDDLRQEILRAYAALGEGGADIDVAVRSSATAEDLPTASFAGQQESFLNIRGERALLEACRQCFASLFTDRAISYRVDKGFDHFAVALSIGVQKMVRSDLGAAGVLFTLDTETGFPDVVLINSAYGLGESVVKGRVDPDEFLVFKPLLESGYRPILKRAVGAKQEKLVYATRGGRSTRAVPVPIEDRRRLSLSDDEVLQLARWGCLIEKHYSVKAGRRCPMDIEWARDGKTQELFILQARPETVHSQARKTTLEVFRLRQQGPVLLTGRAVGERIGVGPVRVIKDVEALQDFQPGEVLVADMTDPDWEPTMKMAAAIVTNRGGRTCHAAIVSREIGVPCVVGAEKATALLQDGQQVTVSCAQGEIGKVYDGALPFERHAIDLGSLARPRTHVMINVGNPDQAFSLAALPNDGVGLAREEFIITSAIQIHPSLSCASTSLPTVRQGEDRPAHRQLSEQGRLLRRAARRRRRPDRRGVSSQGRHRAAFGLQDQRVRQPARRRDVRAQGRESDDRLPRRLALLRPALPRRFCARMPGDEEGPRGDGARQRQADDSVLPHRRGGPPRARSHGGSGAAARRQRP
jgi:pyruvate,water dikinase